MSYGTALNQSQHAEIAPYLSRIEAMQPGSSFTLSGFCKDLSRVRFLIYKYLFHNGLKQSFKISYETPTRIQILRRAAPSLAVGESPTLATIADFVCTELYDATTDEQALARIRQATASGKLDATLAIEVFQDWKIKIKGEPSCG